MKVLFLDVDGVLNCVEDWIEEDVLGHPFNKGCNQINRTKLALLQRVVNETGCKIVLSSTWRKFFELPVFHAMLKDRGFVSEADVFIGKTPEKFSNSVRGVEIRMWLENHPEVTTYAIVDDDNDMLEVQTPYFVRTDNSRGMSYKDAVAIIAILNGGKERESDDPPKCNRLHLSD